MSARYKIGLIMLVCVALGALGSQALHGQATLPAYLIGQIDVSNPDGYAKEYLPTAQVVAIDGDRVVIYTYPSMNALQAWRNDPAYVEVRRIGEQYAKYHTLAAEGAASNSP